MNLTHFWKQRHAYYQEWTFAYLCAILSSSSAIIRRGKWGNCVSSLPPTGSWTTELPFLFSQNLEVQRKKFNRGWNHAIFQQFIRCSWTVRRNNSHFWDIAVLSKTSSLSRRKMKGSMVNLLAECERCISQTIRFPWRGLFIISEQRRRPHTDRNRSRKEEWREQIEGRIESSVRFCTLVFCLCSDRYFWRARVPVIPQLILHIRSVSLFFECQCHSNFSATNKNSRSFVLVTDSKRVEYSRNPHTGDWMPCNCHRGCRRYAPRQSRLSLVPACVFRFPQGWRNHLCGSSL